MDQGLRQKLKRKSVNQKCFCNLELILKEPEHISWFQTSFVDYSTMLGVKVELKNSR